MSFSLEQLAAIGLGYLSLLLVAAYATDRGWIPAKLVRHPATYVLSLGVYASVWTFYGAVGLAHTYGYSFLASYFGASAAFILGPVLLLPLLRLTRSYQLSSIADLFAFRFRSQPAGSLVTLLMLLASLPLFSIQIQAVTETIQLLTKEAPGDYVALFFCLTIALFAILFGARHPSIRHKHEGLVVAMAIESLVKLAALAALAYYALFEVFGGNNGLEQWLHDNAERISGHYQQVANDYWRTLLLAFFTSAIVMPHMFHMLFTENVSPRGLSRAGWGFPLFLLLLAICIPPILWAGMKLDLPGAPEYFGLALGLQANSPLLAVVAFIGGLAAASGIIVVSIIALAGMVINHLMLPILPGHLGLPLYQRLIWARRAIIVAIAVLSYLFYTVTDQITELHQLGLVAFVAFMQFLPGFLATLFWPGGTRQGFLLGLITGMGIWLLTMLLPLFPQASETATLLNLSDGQWHRAAIYSLAANVGVFALVSYLFKPTAQERYTANSCALSTIYRPQANQLEGVTPHLLIERLGPRLGRDAAQREVEHAVTELELTLDETHPAALARLQQRLEVNLSALVGPVEALSLLSAEDSQDNLYQRRDIHLLEGHLERYRSQLTGLAAELDELRRYHRLTLERLPVGVCSLDDNGDIVLWNSEMSRCTAIAPEQALGGRVEQLPPPWNELLAQFIAEDCPHLVNHKVVISGTPHWLSLHKAQLSDRPASSSGQVLLLEDQTETQRLTDELAHSERLASIGRLAAGVAHEVGNPVTGIACLAQNLKYDTEQPDTLEAADQILEQTQRIDRIIKSLMNFAHAGHQNRSEQQQFSIGACVRQAIDLVRLDSRRRDIDYRSHCDDSLCLQGDPQRFLQVLVNLLNNAADASQPGQPVSVYCRNDDESVQLCVEDQGCGIPAELQDRLFDPFFTTKEPGEGTGLGLSLVYSIIEEHYGSVQIESPVDNTQNRGTRVIMTLPLLSTTKPHGSA
ncbi:ATP-binding protein [Motiliproteus sediminis]|uniref:ATP-binding protein n=1 Tax=Motiliproteus sediminis TaxID=1468178 RepID=UPI001FE55811|nr:ATP-binding protein [Motiliproteus sediminis]